MKFSFSIIFLILSFIQSFAQLKVTIGSQEENIYPLELSQPENFNDLTKFQDIIKDKKIIGMGEATHGTKEFFELKAKTFKFLVTTCDLKVFGIEASDGGCSYINDYIRSGVGNIDSVMFYFDFWIWRTQEVKDLVLWIRDYNLLKPESEKVCFYGFDMQNFYTPLQYLNDFFKTDNLINYSEFKSITYPILSRSQKQIYDLSKNPRSNFKDTMTTTFTLLKEWMNKNRSNLEKRYSVKQIERLTFCADNFGQALITLNKGYKFNDRDSCMAFNILRIQKNENAKMFVWAHNGHINTSYSDENISRSLGTPMGGYLRENLGENYYSIGFVFNQGGFQARKAPDSFLTNLYNGIFSKVKLYPVKECIVPINKKNTLTNFFTLLNTKEFFIDLKTSGNPVFLSKEETYDVGSMFYNYKVSTVEIVAKKQFDGLIYVEKTTRATPLSRR